MQGGSVYDVLFGEEYAVDRKAKGTVFADALEKCEADKVNVSLVSSDEMFCRYCIYGDDMTLSLKIVDDTKKDKRYLTDAMVKGIIGNRLVQGYDYNEACDIVFEDAEVIMETAMLEKIAKFKETVERSKKDDTNVFLIYLKIFEGCVDLTELGRMVCERSKFQVTH